MAKSEHATMMAADDVSSINHLSNDLNTTDSTAVKLPTRRAACINRF